MRKNSPPAPAVYLLAVAATVAAVALRWVLDPVLGDFLPLVTVFAAVAFAVWLGGYRAAALVTVLGYLASSYLFIEPRGEIRFDQASDVVGLIVYAFTCGIIIALGEAHRAARRRAIDRGETLRVTLASIDDAVITTDAEGRITYLNPVAETLTGWRQHEALGQPLGVVFRTLNEQTRAIDENPVARALREGVTVGLANQTTLIDRGGKELPIDDSATPILDEQGQVIGCGLVFRDVTARRWLERETAERLSGARLLAAIVESSNDAIISKSLDGIIQTWNAAAEQLFGYTAEQAVGRPISLIIPPDRAEEEERIIERLRAGNRVDHFETVRVRSDGRAVHVSLTISPMLDEAGRVVGASKFARDITAQKDAEKRVYDLMAELKAADRRKDEFLATLAHELRGPLAPLRSMLEVVARADAVDVLHQARATMERQLSHLVRLVDDLLDVSRITRNRLELRRERVELASVLQQALETCRPLAESRQQRIDVSLPSAPVWLDGDPVRLVQVFANLLNNACKYGEAGGKVELRAEPQGSHVVVSVRDHGIGIPAEMLPRIFDMFTPADHTLERSQGGLGIGLSLVQHLVQRHGGSIAAHSAGPGQGSEFVVRLPIAVDQPESSPRPCVEPPPPASKLPPPSRRILVVDDNRDSAAALAMLLKVTGNDTKRRPRRSGGGRSGRTLPSRGRPARHRPAAVERLRRLPSHPRAAVGQGHDAGGHHRLGSGGGPAQVGGSRLRCAHGQAARLRHADVAAGIPASAAGGPRGGLGDDGLRRCARSIAAARAADVEPASARRLGPRACRSATGTLAAQSKSGGPNLHGWVRLRGQQPIAGSLSLDAGVETQPGSHHRAGLRCKRCCLQLHAVLEIRCSCCDQAMCACCAILRDALLGDAVPRGLTHFTDWTEQTSRRPVSCARIAPPRRRHDAGARHLPGRVADRRGARGRQERSVFTAR